MSYSIEKEHDRMDDILDRIRCQLSELRIYSRDDIDEADMVGEVIYMMKLYRRMLNQEIAKNEAQQ